MKEVPGEADDGPDTRAGRRPQCLLEPLGRGEEATGGPSHSEHVAGEDLLNEVGGVAPPVDLLHVIRGRSTLRAEDSEYMRNLGLDGDELTRLLREGAGEVGGNVELESARLRGLRALVAPRRGWVTKAPPIAQGMEYLGLSPLAIRRQVLPNERDRRVGVGPVLDAAALGERGVGRCPAAHE